MVHRGRVLVWQLRLALNSLCSPDWLPALNLLVSFFTELRLQACTAIDFFFFLQFLFISVWTHICMCMGVSGQLPGLGFLLPPLRSQGPNRDVRLHLLSPYHWSGFLRAPKSVYSPARGQDLCSLLCFRVYSCRSQPVGHDPLGLTSPFTGVAY